MISAAERRAEPAPRWALPVNSPPAKVTLVAKAPTTSASTTFNSTYAVGRNGVSRSWRDQPEARSTETDAPALVVAMTAP